MDSWRNRKTLILSRTEMMGLLTPAEYNACVEQAYRMHGERRFYMDPKGHIVLDKYPGEWEAMPSYIEEPEAAACKWVSIREQQPREVRSADRLLDPDLHPSGNRLSARDLRRQPSHGDAHRLGRGGFGQVAGAQGLEGAGDRRRRAHGCGRARDLQRGVPVAGGARLEPLAGTLDHFVAEQQPKYPQLQADRPRPIWRRSCAAPTWW